MKQTKEWICIMAERTVKKIKKGVGRIQTNINGISRKQKRLYSIAFTSLVIGTVAGGVLAGTVLKEKQLKAVAAQRVTLQKEYDEKEKALQEQIQQLENEKENGWKKEEPELPWNMVLVNFEHPMKEGYVPTLKTLMGNEQVDARVYDAAQKMLADAKAAGMDIYVRSGYRSVAEQKYVFNQSVKDRLNQNMDYWEAFEDTRLSVAEPGTSEHALGLALDLVSREYTELDEKQEETKEAKWLAANCHKYGFILRYPPAKTDITGIIYEPWHYRYVGVEDAEKIMSLNVTLEEYLEQYYQK